MPGIAGLISQRPPEECRLVLSEMIASLQHEDFYRSGSYSEAELGIHAGWVTISGSFSDCQPIVNETKDVTLIFSGECFPDPALLVELRRNSHQMKKDDASWLVHLYEDKGCNGFTELSGLYSGILIDKRRRLAFLFNDRYGIDRIYYHEGKDGVYFASEAKALLRVLPELRSFDEGGVAQYLTLGCTLDWKTIFRGVNLLPGGSLWTFEGRELKKGRYFTPDDWKSLPPLSAKAFEARFKDALGRIVPRYFETGSRVGISLTGGLDTRMIMAYLPEDAERPICYTFAGDNGETLDARLADRVAHTCGLSHQVLRIDSQFFSGFDSIADRTVYITDGCFGICGAHEIYLNRKARELAPVRLTGNFGSEVLRGMSTFKPLGLPTGLIAPEFGCQMDYAAAGLGKNHKDSVAFAAFKEIPWSLFGSFCASRSQVSFRTPYLDNEIVALAFQVPAEFRVSSHPAFQAVGGKHSKLGGIPTDRGLTAGKPGFTEMLRRIFCGITFKLDYLFDEGMPHWFGRAEPVFARLGSSFGILGLHKYLHYRSWFRRELAECVSDRLRQQRVRQSPFFNSSFVQTMAEEHASGRRNYVRELNTVLSLEAIERLLLTAPRPPIS